MAWDGIESWEIYKDYFILTATGFDADGETSPYFFPKEKLGFEPSHYSLYVVRTAGLTDAINVLLQGVDHAGASGKFPLAQTDSRGAEHVVSTWAHYDASSFLSAESFAKLRLYTTTVGLGNTLTVTLLGRK